MVFTGGACIELNLGPKALAFLKTSVGTAVFETISQTLVKGDIKKVDIADVAARVFIKNQKARDVVKSFVDMSVQDGFKIKDFNEALQEFGLRLTLNKINDKLSVNDEFGGQKGQRYVIDIIKKVELKEAKEALKPD